MLFFLELNGIVLNQTNEEIVNLGIGVASSELDYDSILEYIRNHWNIGFDGETVAWQILLVCSLTLYKSKKAPKCCYNNV